MCWNKCKYCSGILSKVIKKCLSWSCQLHWLAYLECMGHQMQLLQQQKGANEDKIGVMRGVSAKTHSKFTADVFNIKWILYCVQCSDAGSTSIGFFLYYLFALQILVKVYVWNFLPKMFRSAYWGVHAIKRYHPIQSLGR